MEYLKKISSGEFITYKISDNPEIPTVEISNYETSGATIPTLWFEKEYFTTRGSELIREIFGSKDSFNFPKPIDIVQEAIGRVSKKDSIILDSFAGSGTTAHGVLNLNKDDGGNRKFILVELDEYAETVTAHRIRKVITGYQDIDGDLVEGTGGNFSFYKLGSPILVNDELNPTVPLEKLREYIWFTETQEKYDTASTSIHQDYLGRSTARTAYFFAFHPDQPTALSKEYLATFPEACRAESYVVYADTCLLTNEELATFNITFKKIPRDVTHL